MFDGAIERGRWAAEQAQLSDRVRFELLDVADGLPERYDLISTFDVVHDAIDPVALLRAIRRALKPDGAYLMLEMRCADDRPRMSDRSARCSTGSASSTA